MRFHIDAPASLLVFFVACLGCGSSAPKTYDVKGKLLLTGQPIPVKFDEISKAGGRVRLWIVKQDGGNPPERKEASMSKDGTFLFGEGNKPTAGTYKVCVKWQDSFPTAGDKLENKFDEKNTKIIRKVPEDGDWLIDVSPPEG
jgi:hypothetical protein